MAGKKSRYSEANRDAVPAPDADQVKPEPVVETDPPDVDNQTEARPEELPTFHHHPIDDPDAARTKEPPARPRPADDVDVKPDPLARLHTASQDITTKILGMTCDSKGLHMETTICILGALAGFSTSYAMVTRLVEGALEVKSPEAVIARLKSGDHIVFGEFINRKLVNGEDIAGQNLSLMHVLYEKTGHLAKVEPLDIEALFARVAETIGTPEFGKPKIPKSCRLDETPETYVVNLFSGFLPILEEYDLPVDHYHLAFGLSAQVVMQIGKDILSPDTSAKIFMECAVPMSYLDPRPLMPKS